MISAVSGPTPEQAFIDTLFSGLFGVPMGGSDAATDLREQYRTADGIVRFVRDVLLADPTLYQEDILRAVVERRRVSVRGPHGLGKTALSSWIVLWAMSAFPDDVKVVTTASAWRQLINYTWPEIRKWAGRAKWSEAGLPPIRYAQELLKLGIQLPGKEAFAVASDNPALIEGAHASVILYVFDEAKAIPAGTWDAVEGAFSTGEAYALAISTPGEPSGRFYDIHSRKPGYTDWWARHVTLDEAIQAGRINPEWVDARRKQWGEQSAVYQNRVLGEFAESGEDSVVPLSWVEQAVQRWQDAKLDGKQDGKQDNNQESIGVVSFGVDPARFGEDRTAIAKLCGNTLEYVRTYSKQDTMQTVGRVILLLNAEPTGKQTPVGVDVIGLGAGVYDRLKEQGYRVHPVNVAEGTNQTDESGTLSFINLRSQLWWMLRERLDPAKPDALMLPPDDELIGDLTAPAWQITSAGKIKVESKDDIRQRIGRSTDKADALALALYAVRPRGGVWFA